MIARRIDMQLQLDGIVLGTLLVGSEDARLCAGNGKGAGEVRVVSVQDVEAAPGCFGGNPLGAGDAFIALRPHPAQLRGKAEGEVGGMKAVKLEQDEGAGTGSDVVGRKHDLVDGEGGVGIGDDGAVRTDFDFGRLLVDIDGNRVTLDVSLDRQVREQLYREHPGFKGPVLLAEQDAALAGHGEWLEQFGVRPDQGTGVVEREEWNRGERLGLDCGS
jgi:hypothetical protein